MRFYGLSEARVRRILHSPNRTEEGIAPKTTAFMQSTGSKRHPYELWAMVQDAGSHRKVISAWRYPGVTKPFSGTAMDFLRGEYSSFLESETKKEAKKELDREKMKKSKWFKVK